MNLYEIEMELHLVMQTAREMAEASGGEINEFIASEIDHWEAEKDVKISNTCKYIKNLLAESEMVGNEAKKLADRARAAKNKAESCKAWLASFLSGEKWSDENSKINWRESKSVNITNESQIPECFIDMIPKYNKLEIKKILTAGGEVDGCVLDKKQNIQIK